MPDTRASSSEAKIQELSATVLKHSDQFMSIQDALAGINQKLHDLAVANAKAEKQPLLPTPPNPASPLQQALIQPSDTNTHTNTPRLPKLEIPLFTGDNVTGWIFQIERFFHLHVTPPEQRLVIATFYMTGPALLWYQWMHSTKQLTSWDSFRHDLELRFGPSTFINHEAALYKLRQTSSVSSYVSDFESLSTCTPGLTTHNLLNCFISGLREDIKRELFVHRPVLLSEAVGLAKLIESKVDAQRFHSRPPAQRSSSAIVPHHPQHSSPTSTQNNLPIRRLTKTEMSERRQKGLCYNCDEHYTPNHRCTPKFLCMLIESDVEDLTEPLYQPPLYHEHQVETDPNSLASSPVAT